MEHCLVVLHKNAQKCKQYMNKGVDMTDKIVYNQVVIVILYNNRCKKVSVNV